MVWSPNNGRIARSYYSGQQLGSRHPKTSVDREVDSRNKSTERRTRSEPLAKSKDVIRRMIMRTYLGSTGRLRAAYQGWARLFPHPVTQCQGKSCHVLLVRSPNPFAPADNRLRQDARMEIAFSSMRIISHIAVSGLDGAVTPKRLECAQFQAAKASKPASLYAFRITDCLPHIPTQPSPAPWRALQRRVSVPEAGIRSRARRVSHDMRRKAVTINGCRVKPHLSLVSPNAA